MKKQSTQTILKRWFQRCIVIGLAAILTSQLGCAQLRLPAIDPTGNQIFRPGGTQLLTPGATRSSVFGQNQFAQPNNGPLNGFSRTGANPILQPQPFSAPPAITNASQYPIQPAFQHPATPPPCNEPIGARRKTKKTQIPNVTGTKSPGQNGQIIMTPSRIVAPVGSEVVVLAGICGGDGYFVKNQPLEWMLSNNSVGELIEVGGQHHSKFNQLIPPTAKKFSGQYAWGRTGLKNIVLTRGTPTPVDDIDLAKGQTFVSVSSASPGTSYVTAVAPKAEGWDKRKASTIIHWVDGQWAVPAPSRATAGTVHPLTTVVSSADGAGVKGWETRYSIVGGAPAEFAPTGSQTATATTDSQGNATVQIRQPAGQFEPGTTQVRVDIVRPPVFGEPELVVESGITNVTWSAPALTIRAIGPRKSEIDEPFNYRVEVTNPGDQVSRGVVVRTKDLDDAIEFISSNPKPTEYGRQYEWQLGDIAPGSPAKIIDIQMKSKKQGNVGMCFEVASETDRLQTEACAETEIVMPCIGYRIQGPTTANVGDTISYNISVENQCDEPLEDIEIIVNYDPSLVRPGRSNPARFQNPILQVGESQPLPEALSFFVQAPGTHCFNIEIRARGVQPQFDRRCVEVQPAIGTGGGGSTGGSSSGDSPLQLSLRPTVSAEGRPVIEATVTNNGNNPLDQVALINKTPDSITPYEITPEFRNNIQTFDDQMLVGLGRINPGQTVKVEISYDVLANDPNAFSEMTVSTPSGASDNQRIAVPTQTVPQGDGVDRPDFNDLPGDGGIVIPDGDSSAVPTQPGGLSVRVQSLDPNIRLGQQARVQFTVKNNSQVPLNNVDIRIPAMPNSIQFVEIRSDDTDLGFESQWQLGRINTLRPNDEITWTMFLEGRLAGQTIMEVQAKSDDTVGVASGSDSFSISD